MINRIFDTKVDAIGLSVFRMCYTVILSCEIMQLFRFRNIIFDKIPFVETGEIDVLYVFVFWFFTLGLLFIGLFTRVATILNYILSVIVFSSMAKFEYHIFYTYVGTNLLLMFMPVSRVFSMDSLVEKIKYTNIGRPYKPDRKVLEINYLIIVFTGIGLTYIDSVFRKFNVPLWRDGLGMWLPSSLPMMVWNDTSIILNHEWLVKFLGYLVMVFELVFIFLFWFRKFRVPFLLLGIFFHIGILITYPIPWFALAVIAIYLLLVPQSFWLLISRSLKKAKPVYQFYYDAECPLCSKVVVTIRHFDVFNTIECITVQGNAKNQPALKNIPESDLLINIHGVSRNGKVAVGFDAYIHLLKNLRYTYPIALILSLPGFLNLGKKIYSYIAGNRLTERCTSENCAIPHFSEPVSETTDFLVSGWNRLAFTKIMWKAVLVFFCIIQLIITSDAILPKNGLALNAINKVGRVVRPPMKKFTGLTSHALFVSGHFNKYNHIFKVVCTNNNKIVPILDENGMVKNSYAHGGLWANCSFRMNSPILEQSVYESGLIGYLRYFEKENGLQPSDYKIFVKYIEPTDHWQKDFLHKQMKQPWAEAGSCKLSATTAKFSWNETMNAIFESEKNN